MSDEPCEICVFLQRDVYAKKRPHLRCQWCRGEAAPIAPRTRANAARRGGLKAQKKLRAEGVKPYRTQEVKVKLTRRRAA